MRLTTVHIKTLVSWKFGARGDDILLAEKTEVLHMLLTEYDERKHLKNTFREGREEGL